MTNYETVSLTFEMLHFPLHLCISQNVSKLFFTGNKEVGGEAEINKHTREAHFSMARKTERDLSHTPTK